MTHPVMNSSTVHCATVKAVQWCSYKAEEHFLFSHDIGLLPIVHKFQLGIFPLPKLLHVVLISAGVTSRFKYHFTSQEEKIVVIYRFRAEVLTF